MESNLHAIQLHVYQADSHLQSLVVTIVVLDALEILTDPDQGICGASQRELLTQACSEQRYD